MTLPPLVLAGLLTGALFLSAPLRAQPAIAVSAEASGELPGFRIEEAAPFLAEQMNKAGIAAWHFVPRDPTAAAPNRIEWTFELLPYAGGQVRQLFPMAGVQRMLGAHRLISAEAKLYLGGQYQTVTFGQEAVQGGAGDPELAAFIARVTQMLHHAYDAIDMTPVAHKTRSP